MFDFLTNPIENALGILQGLTYGELPSKRQVAQLVSDGVTIYAISAATGIATDVIESLIED